MGNTLKEKADKEKRNRGPEPERLRIADSEWKSAVNTALRKKKPKEGWPKPNGA